ncbi:metallophosphoesterase [bacterium]|nr:metallophosphoesterase [candidate division CSSED10-310 bacterium]
MVVGMYCAVFWVKRMRWTCVSWLVGMMVACIGGGINPVAAGGVVADEAGLSHASEDAPAVRFAILGDRTGQADEGVFAEIVAEIVRMDPDWVINVGDLIEGPQPDDAAVHAEWDRVMASLAAVSCPIVYVPGNNDIFSEESLRIFSERTGRRSEYSCDCAGVHVIVLDNSRMNGWDAFSFERRAWLESDLQAASARAVPIWVFYHKPFWLEHFAAGTEDPLHGLFVRYGVDRVFSGHYHRYLAKEKDGIQYTMIGSSGGRCGANATRGEFYHFGWVTVRGGSSRLAVVQAGATKSESWLTLDRVLAQDAVESCLFDLHRPEMEFKRPMGIKLVFSDRCGVVSGRFVWELADTGWVISPSSGRFDVSQGPVEVDFSSQVQGLRYPLPGLKLVTELDGRSFEIRDRLSPIVSVPMGRVSDDHRVDGRLNEKFWDSDMTAVIDDFGSEDGGVCPTEPVEIRLVFGNSKGDRLIGEQEKSGDRLCIGIRAKTREGLMDKVNENETPVQDRDGPVFLEDSVYLYFWTGPELSRLTQIVLNRKGALLDQQGQVNRSGARPEMQKEWNGDILWAVDRSVDGWVGELAISCRDLGIQLEDTSIRLNVIRYQADSQTLSVWIAPPSFNPEDAGRLVLIGDGEKERR